MSTLTIIRGLPGSGKTTLAKTFNGVFHLELDMFMMNDGEYEFDRTKFPVIIPKYIEIVKSILDTKCDLVISNTFTKISEFEEYIDYANELGYNVVVYCCTHNYGSIHGIPKDTYEIMKNRFEDYPEEQEYVRHCQICNTIPQRKEGIIECTNHECVLYALPFKAEDWSKMRIYKEKPGTLSENEIWVCICGWYIYVHSSLNGLIDIMVNEWEGVQHQAI